MALIDRAIERYSAAYILNLTNPDAASASSTDTTRRNLAAQDAQAEFEEIAGIVYDETDDNIVRLAVEGVIVVLKERGSARSDGAKKARTEWERKCKAFNERFGALSRMSPKTTGIGSPSGEQIGTETVRPKFDEAHFDDVVPNNPRSGHRSDDP